jgi:membrane associated rhomboid family serine protease
MLFVLAMWMAFYYNDHYNLGLQEFGLRPHSLVGLLGIFTLPLLHADLGHILSNTLPILIFGTLLFYYYREVAVRVFFYSLIATGLCVWIFGQSGTTHIGASGVLYSLAGFLFFSGIIRRNKTLFGVSLLITFLYGTIIWGVLPAEFLRAIRLYTEHTNYSWEGHLFGFLSGTALAFVYRKVGTQEPEYSWDKNNDEDVDESDPYWMVDEDGKPLNEKPRDDKNDILKNTSDNPYTVTYTFIPKKDDAEK